MAGPRQCVPRPPDSSYQGPTPGGVWGFPTKEEALVRLDPVDYGSPSQVEARLARKAEQRRLLEDLVHLAALAPAEERAKVLAGGRRP